MMDELNDSFQNDFTNMNNVADMLVQMSTTQNCIDNFNTKLKSVTKAFNDFNLFSLPAEYPTRASPFIP